MERAVVSVIVIAVVGIIYLAVTHGTDPNKICKQHGGVQHVDREQSWTPGSNGSPGYFTSYIAGVTCKDGSYHS